MIGDLEETPSETPPELPQNADIEMASKVKEGKATSFLFDQWLKQFELESSPEKKIQMAIECMRTLLSQEETPRFKDFWECRRLCLLLFKENISPKLRAQLWGQYIELSKEAQALKNLLDEQAAFAIEQIELAILSIESDLEHFTLLLAQAPDIAFPEESVLLKGKKDLYNTMQKELQLLHTSALRINALRKEVIKTEMRIRIKNRLLERLSICGDRVFPRRKELITNISQAFTTEVDRFVRTHFQAGESKELPLHILREEIKSLQSLAKALSLSTPVFTETRFKLSACWDQIRDQEKERKKEITQKKHVYRQNYDLVLKKIQAFEEECRGQLSTSAGTARFQEILDFMKTVDLGRIEVKALKDELFKVRKTFFDREQEKQNQRNAMEKELQMDRRNKVDSLKEELIAFTKQLHQFNSEQINVKQEEFSQAFEQMGLNKIEKQEIDRVFKQFKDALAERKKKALLSLSEDDLKSLEQLKVLLYERIDRRAEIKEQLEQYRKALGGSGFDFEKAMMYRELIESEKKSLEKIETAIEELEQKIEDIES